MTSLEPHRVRFGPFEADLDTHELWKNGVRVKLGGQPFEILTLLLRKPGQMVSREELQKELWAADTFVDFNHGLNAAVNKLRETLADSAEEPKYVETLPRRGYRFVGKIQSRPPALPLPAANGGEMETGVPTEPSLPAVPRLETDPPTVPIVDARGSRFGRRWHGIAAVAGAIAVAATIFGVVLSTWPVIEGTWH